ncbi:MAG: hypothetical protein VX737_06805 [Pseudomonadota bacterium]|nr:hypothetical protein [Pseudomonadota bacterium]
MKDFVAHAVIFGAVVYIVYPSAMAIYSAVVCFSFAQSLCFWLQGQKKGWRRENGLKNPFSFNSFLVLWLSRGRLFISRSQGDGISSANMSRDAQSHLIKSVFFGVLVNIGIAKLLLQCAIYWPHSTVIFTWYASMQLACALISMAPLPGSPGFALISPQLPSRMVDFLQQEFCQLALCVFCALLSHQVPLIGIANTAATTLGVISFPMMYSALGLGGLVLLEGVPELRLSKRLDVDMGKYMPFDSGYFSKSKKQKSESREKVDRPSIKDRIVQMMPRVFR